MYNEGILEIKHHIFQFSSTDGEVTEQDVDEQNQTESGKEEAKLSTAISENGMVDVENKTTDSSEDNVQDVTEAAQLSGENEFTSQENGVQLKNVEEKMEA